MTDGPEESTPFSFENVLLIFPFTRARGGPVFGFKYGLRHFIELAPFSDYEICNILRHAMIGKIEMLGMWFACVVAAVNGMVWNTGAIARDWARGPADSLPLIAHVLRSTSITGFKSRRGTHDERIAKIPIRPKKSTIHRRHARSITQTVVKRCSKTRLAT